MAGRERAQENTKKVCRAGKKKEKKNANENFTESQLNKQSKNKIALVDASSNA